MQNLSVEFLQYLHNKSQDITEEILECAKDCLCDYLGVTEAGAIANNERWTVFCEHASEGKTSVIGMDVTTDGKTAALINGYNAHSLELDDGHRFAMIHLGASIISALHSAKCENDISQEKLLVGIIMGYEAACRIAIAIQPSHKKKGFHAAGTCGTIGAAIGVAFALGMDIEQMKTVLASAVASTTGMLEIQGQSSELKPYNLGRAAMDGLVAAYMGYTDFVGPDDMLGGERGFLNLFSDECTPAKAVEKQGYFEIERIYVKPYAACRHCHSAIEAALTLRENIDINEIERIVVETYQLAVKGHNHTQISGITSAKLSMPYSVAVAIVLGKADVSAFSFKCINRDDILDLTKKVTIVENTDFTSQNSKKRTSKVVIYLQDGTSKAYQVDFAKGDPENPMSREEIKAKTIELLGKIDGERVCNQVYTR